MTTKRKSLRQQRSKGVAADKVKPLRSDVRMRDIPNDSEIPAATDTSNFDPWSSVEQEYCRELAASIQQVTFYPDLYRQVFDIGSSFIPPDPRERASAAIEENRATAAAPSASRAPRPGHLYTISCETRQAASMQYHTVGGRFAHTHNLGGTELQITIQGSGDPIVILAQAIDRLSPLSAAPAPMSTQEFRQRAYLAFVSDSSLHGPQFGATEIASLQSIAIDDVEAAVCIFGDPQTHGVVAACLRAEQPRIDIYQAYGGDSTLSCSDAFMHVLSEIARRG